MPQNKIQFQPGMPLSELIERFGTEAQRAPWSGRAGPRDSSARSAAQYRVNRRFELRSLVDRLLWTCARTEPCPESWLRLGVIRAS